MNDRELLELAAKAAGVNLAWFNGYPKHGTADGQPTAHEWNPLTDDGDALRLAVRLSMDVCIDGDQACAYGAHDGPPPIENDRGDICAATRRAIVRAAAEIGKATASPPECTPARPAT